MGAVLSWLSRAGTVEGRRLLIGCALDDGVNTDTVPIVGLEWGVGGAPLALLLEGGGRKLFRQVADGAVVDARPGAPLVAAIEAARTPAELAERGERRELVQAGVNPDRLGSTEDRRAVLALCPNLAARRVPPAEVRRAAHLALRAGGQAENARSGARLFREVFALCRDAGVAALFLAVLAPRRRAFTHWQPVRSYDPDRAALRAKANRRCAGLTHRSLIASIRRGVDCPAACPGAVRRHPTCRCKAPA
jgi:hypothetical protein